MRMGLLGVAVSLSVLAAAPNPVSAHHSFSAEFDAKLPLELRGTITKVERVNPHAWIHIDVKGSDGKVVSWAVETGAPMQLARQGVTREALPIGVEVIIKGFRARDGSPTISGDFISLPGGRSFDLGSSRKATP